MFVVPRFSVDGEPDHELDSDLSGLQIESTRYGRPSMHAEFAAAHTLEVGTTIEVSSRRSRFSRSSSTVRSL